MPEISASFAGSIEAQAGAGTLAAAQADALYKTILGRDMDAPSGSNVMGALLAEFSPRDLAKGILASPERAARSGITSDSDFVSGLYHDGVGRAPDAEGFANWSKVLSTGYSRDMMAGDFASSAEALAHAGYGGSIHFT